MKLFELALGNVRRYIAAADHEDAYKQGTDPLQHPDLCFLPFAVTEVTVPGYTVALASGADIPTEREALKAWLTERGVEFNPRLGDAKLIELAQQATSTRDVESIARLCHEVNRAYCLSIGDDSQPAWESAPDWQRESAMNGVRYHLDNETTPEQSHENWMREKVEAGWVYGPVKDSDKKEHPCIVPYDQLPIEQRTKDYLFKAIVDTFR